MSFRGTFNLENFTDRLVAHTCFGVIRVHGLAVEHDLGVHQAIANVAVVWNREIVHAGLSLQV